MGFIYVQVKWPKLGPSKIVKNFRIEEASDFWNRYEQDIQLAKDLGATQMAAQRPLLWAALIEGRAMALQDYIYNFLFSGLAHCDSKQLSRSIAVHHLLLRQHAALAKGTQTKTGTCSYLAEALGHCLDLIRNPNLTRPTVCPCIYQWLNRSAAFRCLSSLNCLTASRRL